MKGTSIPVKGELEEHSVNRLLQMLLEEGLSGCLTVTRGKTKRSLYFREGTIIYAASNDVHDRLGEIFIVQGKLSRSIVDAAFKKGKRLKTQLGMILLVDGHINAQDLFQAVTAQVVAILERMRSWRKGKFSFEEGHEPEAGTVLMHIPLALYLGAADKGADRAARASKRTKASRASKTVKAPKKKKAPRKVESKTLVLDEEVLKADAEAPPAEEPVGEAPAEEAPGGETPAGEAVPEEVLAEGIGWQEVNFDDGNGAEDIEKAPLDAEDFPNGGLDAPLVPDAEAEGEGDDAEKRRRLVEEIVFQVQELRRRAERGPYVLLGVGATAPVEEVHEAYHYLAKLLHPDGRPPELPEESARGADDLLKDVVAAYGEINAARSAEEAAAPAASGPSRRAPADMGAVDGSDASRRLFYRAKEYIAKGNYWQAADSMRQAVRFKPGDAMYRNLLGFCLMQTGRRLHEAEEHIREAVRLDPGNPDYITNLGLVYKAGRFYKKAREMFQQALVYDKKHQLARQELKKIPREGEASGGIRSFWQKLRGG